MLRCSGRLQLLDTWASRVWMVAGAETVTAVARAPAPARAHARARWCSSLMQMTCPYSVTAVSRRLVLVFGPERLADVV
jgi:hypothetical protein